MRFSKFCMLFFCCVFTFGLLLAAPIHGVAKKINAKDIPEISAEELLSLVAKEKGKIFIVNIFASWCPPCREEVPVLVKMRQGFPADKIVLIGVSVDKEPKALANFMEEFAMNYPVYLASNDFIRKVGVSAVPQLLIYNKKGELVVNHKGLVDEEDLKKAVDTILAE